MSDETPDFRCKSTRLLQVIPVFILVTLADIFISCSAAVIVLVQLIASEHNRYLSLGTAILIAVGVHAYLLRSHKIRNFIKLRSQDE